MPKAVKGSYGDNNSTMGTDQIDSYDTSFPRSELLRIEQPKGKIESSNLVLSTPVPFKPNSEGVYEWCRFFKLNFDSN
jgi:hypothetical protein